MSMDLMVDGLQSTLEKLKQFSTSVETRLVERAGRAALKPVVADVRGHVAVDQGALKKSIGVKKAKRVPKGLVVLSVGARRGFNYKDADGNNVDPFYYSIPYEYGHVLKRDGKVVGHVAPAGVFRSAYERGKIKVVEDFASELNDRIEAEAAKP